MKYVILIPAIVIAGFALIFECALPAFRFIRMAKSSGKDKDKKAIYYFCAFGLLAFSVLVIWIIAQYAAVLIHK